MNPIFNYPGKFIVFEGIDCSGKTTQAKRLVDYLNNELHKPAVFTFEPGDTEYGKHLRLAMGGEYNKEKISNAENLFLFLADRVHHMRIKVIPLLMKGYYVICDRYIYSTDAYQFNQDSILNDSEIYDKYSDVDLSVYNDRLLKFMDTMDIITGHKFPEFIVPDATLYVDINVNTFEKRKQERGICDPIEDTYKYRLEQIRKRYNSLFQEKPVLRNSFYIDGEKEQDRVWGDVKEIIDEKLKEWRND
jgi:thymidylate kinase